jgi:hypothetical protein
MVNAMSRPLNSQEIWQNLYQAALDFKNIRPWEWLSDDQVFGVQNPVSGEIGYCCVMGALKEVFALGVYLGSDGLEVYTRMQSGKIGPEEVYYQQRCLIASFEDREELDKTDLEQIRKLGFKFRGRKSWPVFRSYLPGYQPWYLTDEEAEYLTLALHQATQVAQRIEKDRNLLKSKLKNHYLVRVPAKQDDSLSWQDAWLTPAPSPKIDLVYPQPDLKRLAAIKKSISKKQGIWEIDVFYSPLAVKEQGRPYYPLMLLFVDQKYGLLLTMDLAPQAEYQRQFQTRFLEFIEKVRFLPEEVLVEKPDVHKLFEPLAINLNLRIRLVKRLTILPETRAELMEHFLPR